jgi:hypothetical protein
MSCAIVENHRFHQMFHAASGKLQQGQLDNALRLLTKARASALAASDDEVLGANAQQNYVTASLIIMGVQFRLQHHADTLSTYHALFKQLEHWLEQADSDDNLKRLRGFQALAEKACRHLHLERFREETRYASSTK